MAEAVLLLQTSAAFLEPLAYLPATEIPKPAQRLCEGWKKQE
ncbi:hypothetical protein [Corynebacterium vitaeruminis]|nr:hypothetical protein [Corynebacterium vitaeruminis]